MAIKKYEHIDNEDLAGQLLVSAPYLEGGGFDHSVIFLTHVEERFIIGHILNHPTGQKVGEVAQHAGIPKELYSVPLYKGGPVERNQLIFAAFVKTKDNFRIQFNLQETQALECLKNPGALLRAYVGHSSWSQSQLRRELKDRAWYLSTMNPDICIEPDSSKVWDMAMRRLSPLHHIMSHAPAQPNLN